MHGAGPRSDPELGPEPGDTKDLPGATLDDLPGAKPRSPADPRPAASGERVVLPERYEVGEEIARGGIGRILRARDRELGRAVALKELVREDPIAVERFRREIRITATLQHPNIVPLHDAGRWPNGQLFYAMKLVEGKTLAVRLREAETFSSRLLLLPVLLDVAEALAYAHSEGVVHRDLKPANVLVGPFGETVVIDWGLAKHVDEKEDPSVGEAPRSHRAYETSVGAVLGTPAYMPPEQASGHEVDFKADVYALGAMLYHLIAGKSPYAGHDERTVLSRVQEVAPEPLLRLAPDAPRDLVAIAEKAMARDAADRYPTARELAEELRRFATGGLVGAYRYGLMDLLARFFERQRAVVITVLLAISALAAFGAAGVARITEERDRAQKSAVAEAKYRADAEERVDQLLVEKARALLDRDPTESVAWLKRPRTTLAGAPTIAAWAEERGIAEHVLRGHQAAVTTIAYSPDGRLIATGGDDKRVVLWDGASGRALELSGHTDRVTRVAFSADGQVLASASYDATVRLHDGTGTLLRVLSGHRAPVKNIAFSARGDSLCSVSTDGEVRVWKAATGEFRSKTVAVERDPYCGFSPDGAWVLSGSHGSSIRLWNPDTDAEMLRDARSGQIHFAEFSPDGKSVATGGVDGALRLWPVPEGAVRVLGKEEASVQSLAFSPDGRHVASAGMNGHVRLWDLTSGSSRIVSEHGERVAAIAFSADGRYLASSGWDRVVRVFDLHTEASTSLRGHGDVVGALAFSPDGTHLASASWDKTVRIWNAHHTHERRVFRGHTVGVRTVAFSPDGQFVASGGHDDTVRLFPIDGGTPRVFSGHTDHVYRVVFSPDGRFLASSSDDRTVRIWSVAGDSVKVLSGHQDDVEELAFSPDGTRLASASEDGTARLHHLDGDGPPVILEHDHDVTGVVFDKKGERLATASRDRTVRIWDGKTGAPIRVLRGHTDEVWGLAIAADGSRIASASADDSVMLWTASGESIGKLSPLPGARLVSFSPDGSQVGVAGVAPRVWVCNVVHADCSELNGHTAVIHDLAFLPDGHSLVTVSGDGTVDVWDLDTHERRVLEGHAAPVFGLALSPDGRTIASAGADATVRLWAVVRPPRPSVLRAYLDGLSHEELAPGIGSSETGP